MNQFHEGKRQSREVELFFKKYHYYIIDTSNIQRVFMVTLVRLKIKISLRLKRSEDLFTIL